MSTAPAPQQFVGWLRTPAMRRWFPAATGADRSDVSRRLMVAASMYQHSDQVVLARGDDPNQTRRPSR